MQRLTIKAIVLCSVEVRWTENCVSGNEYLHYHALGNLRPLMFSYTRKYAMLSLF
jgi:hypothetical protein